MQCNAMYCSFNVVCKMVLIDRDSCERVKPVAPTKLKKCVLAQADTNGDGCMHVAMMLQHVVFVMMLVPACAYSCSRNSSQING